MSINSGGSVFANQPIPPLQFSTETLAEDQLLVYSETLQAFTNETRPSVTTVTSLGGGESIFASKVDNDLQFKSLIPGANVTFDPITGNSITINADPSNAITGVNLDPGTSSNAQVFKQKVGYDLQFRTIKVDPGAKHLAITQDADYVFISTQGEINTATSSGTGPAADITYGKSAENLNFRGILGGQQISAVDSGTDVLISTDFGFNGTLDQYKLLQANPTGDIIVVPDGNVGAVLRSLGTSNGVEWSDQSFSVSKTMKIEFDGTGNLQTVDSSSIPADFTSVTVVGNQISVAHTLGTWPKSISYFGWDSTIMKWKYREPTGIYQVMLPTGNETTEFEINVVAAITGSNISGYAYVNMVF